MLRIDYSSLIFVLVVHPCFLLDYSAHSVKSSIRDGVPVLFDNNHTRGGPEVKSRYAVSSIPPKLYQAFREFEGSSQVVGLCSIGSRGKIFSGQIYGFKNYSGSGVSRMCRNLADTLELVLATKNRRISLKLSRNNILASALQSTRSSDFGSCEFLGYAEGDPKGTQRQEKSQTRTFESTASDPVRAAR